MYEIVMAILAVIAVIIAFLDISGKLVYTPLVTVTETIIWIIFVADYVFRLIKSESKKVYVKSNIFDLVSILPFSSFLRVFRFARILRVAKLARLSKMTKMIKFFAFFGRFGTKLKSILSTNGFIYVLYINVIIIFLGSVGIYFTELGDTVHSFPDSIWWSFVTATTVGYGDISPSTGIGRIIAVILMLLGIGTIGMLTSTLSTYFLTPKKDDGKIENPSLMESINALSEDQRRIITELIKSMNGQ